MHGKFQTLIGESKINHFSSLIEHTQYRFISKNKKSNKKRNNNTVIFIHTKLKKFHHAFNN